MIATLKQATVIWHFPCLFSLPLCNLLFHNFSTPLTPPVHPLAQCMILLFILLSKPEANRRKSPLVSPSHLLLPCVCSPTHFLPSLLLAMNALSVLLVTTSLSFCNLMLSPHTKHIMTTTLHTSSINQFPFLSWVILNRRQACYLFFLKNKHVNKVSLQTTLLTDTSVFLPFQNLFERIGCSHCLEPLHTSMLS